MLWLRYGILRFMSFVEITFHFPITFQNHFPCKHQFRRRSVYWCAICTTHCMRSYRFTIIGCLQQYTKSRSTVLCQGHDDIPSPLALWDFECANVKNDWWLSHFPWKQHDPTFSFCVIHAEEYVCCIHTSWNLIALQHRSAKCQITHAPGAFDYIARVCRNTDVSINSI